jgi:glutathionylspermidine synthase
MWLEDGLAGNVIPTGSDQFNSLHEKLIARFAEIAASANPSRVLHLSCMPDSVEDRGLIAYLEDCARQAGFATKTLGIGDIGTTGKGPFATSRTSRSICSSSSTLGNGCLRMPSAGLHPWL